MKNIFMRFFVVLSCALLLAACSDEEPKPAPGPGGPGGPAPATGYVFQTIKFGYDYVGTAAVLNSDNWNDLEFRDQIVQDVINKRNLPESHDVALECAGTDGTGKRPDVASIRVWFEKVCEPVEGYYDIAIYFVRMFVEIEIPGECGTGTSIIETYDFWENASALNSHPDNMIPNGSRQFVRAGEEIPFDPFNIDLKVLDSETLQGKLGTLIQPSSRYDVKLNRQLQYIGGRGENITAEQCNEAGAPAQGPNKASNIVPEQPEQPTPVPGESPEDVCDEHNGSPEGGFYQASPPPPPPAPVPPLAEPFVLDRSCSGGGSTNNTMDPQRRGYIGTKKPGSDPINPLSRNSKLLPAQAQPQPRNVSTGDNICDVCRQDNRDRHMHKREYDSKGRLIRVTPFVPAPGTSGSWSQAPQTTTATTRPAEEQPQQKYSPPPPPPGPRYEPPPPPASKERKHH